MSYDFAVKLSEEDLIFDVPSIEYVTASGRPKYALTLFQIEQKCSPSARSIAP